MHNIPNSQNHIKQLSSDTNLNTYLLFDKEKFEVDSRYEIVEPIGSGAYGVVVQAKDTKMKPTLDNDGLDEDLDENMVAIKKINRAFE